MVAVAALPVILIPQVPLAHHQTLVGASLAISLFTNSVVANCIVLVPTAAVGAVAVPVRAGEAIGAKYAILCPSRRSALRLVLTVVDETASGAVPVARVEIS